MWQSSSKPSGGGRDCTRHPTLPSPFCRPHLVRLLDCQCQRRVHPPPRRIAEQSIAQLRCWDRPGRREIHVHCPSMSIWRRRTRGDWLLECGESISNQSMPACLVCLSCRLSSCLVGRSNATFEENNRCCARSLLREQETRTLAKTRGLHLQLGYPRPEENPELVGTTASPCLLPMRVAECLDEKVLF